MIRWLKCFYQTFVIKASLGFYSVFGKKKDPLTLAAQKIMDRGFSWQSGRATKVFAIFSISNWEEILLEPLNKIGETFHFTWTDGKYFFPDKAGWEVFHKKLNEDLLTDFNNFYNDSDNILVFIYASDFSISEETLNAIRRKNVMLVSFCWDDLLYFKGSVKGQPVGIDKLSRYADINLTLSPEAIPRYLYNNSPCFFWKSLPLKVKTAEMLLVERNEFYVLFVGSKYGWREQFITDLRKEGITVKCFGDGWENGSLPEKEMWAMIKNAPVTLGFANVGYTKTVTTIKGRDFEVPLHGGLFLTQYSEGLSFYYDTDNDIYTYRNFEECVQQIMTIKKNESVALNVRNNGYHKALSTATWDSRFLYLDALIMNVTQHSSN